MVNDRVAFVLIERGGRQTASPQTVLKEQLPTAAELGSQWSVESPPSFKTDAHGDAGAQCNQSIVGDELTAYFGSIATGQYLEVKLISSPRAEQIFKLVKRSVTSGCYFTSEPKLHVPAGTKTTKISYQPGRSVSGIREIALRGKSGNNPVIYDLVYFFQKGSTFALISEDGVGRSDLSVVRTAASKLR